MRPNTGDGRMSIGEQHPETHDRVKVAVSLVGPAGISRSIGVYRAGPLSGPTRDGPGDEPAD